MPHWTFELSPNALSAAEKATLARQITETGGEAPPKAIFFYIDHAASGFPSEDRRLAFIARVNKIVRPILEPKDIKWEYNIYEHPRVNWRVNGMIPPVDHPDIWQQWFEGNQPVMYDDQLPPKDEKVIFHSVAED
ncbi:uncharacterized protein P174DRAFT_420128 [Aspergillus novofumigatus IBT 16806]|uniref:Tautomerase cis-CaaD-like domain-containing protein n=1 Tax=Aspergillus novofumigatus (strain IBT 16806) TaxID=1392255 RepID=A0A2I1C7B1_ASPN1|nr:uncharacterized protein P174DRAFT_420128 [Aspergillus novofumigatus IBT 16806]PKX93528.1 hypothetical protein P174DRAFT_420128 [Aspergillus novofumigatus IBT 16806]